MTRLKTKQAFRRELDSMSPGDLAMIVAEDASTIRGLVHDANLAVALEAKVERLTALLREARAVTPLCSWGGYGGCIQGERRPGEECNACERNMRIDAELARST